MMVARAVQQFAAERFEMLFMNLEDREDLKRRNGFAAGSVTWTQND